MIKKLKLFMIAVIVLLSAAQASFAQGTVIANDPDVKIGKLKNGMTYYIRKNAKPENRLFLRLVVNAGSLQEADNQQGLAHFVEHMCFNGTKHFEKNVLVDVLERMGMQFGAEINAYTSFDETVYMLKVPTDKPGMVDTAFTIMEDWAHNVTFADAEIDKERGVIKEEWRLGLGANDRMRKEYFPVLLAGSRYAERMPIGKIDVIEKFEYQTLKDFYKDWYRPDLMAVIVVGDMEVEEIEKYVKKHFSKIKKAKKAKERVVYSVPDNKEPLISMVSDPENTNFVINMFYKRNTQDLKTTADYREYLKQNLYNGMINARMRERMQDPNSPIMYGGMSYGGFIGRSKDAYTSYAVTKENKILEGLEVLFHENLRVKQHGFTATELERQKASLLNSYDRMLKEADKIESENYIEEYQVHFLEGEAIPSKADESKIASEQIPSITLQEINELATKWITDENMAMVIMVPKKEDVNIYQQDELKQIIDIFQKLRTAPYVDQVSTEPILKTVPTASKITNRTDNAELGFTQVTFANGVVAILKSTNYKNDEILIRSFSPGGNSIYPDADIMSAMFTSGVINNSGLSDFNDVNLKKKLAGKTVNISTYLNELHEGINGFASPKDLETFLQLNYLYFTAPRMDKDIFASEVSKLQNQLKLITNNPQVYFADSLNKVVNSHHPRAIYVPTEKHIQSINHERIMQIYQDRFNDAGDFVYVLVGNFKIDSILPMLETYLGGLPTKNRKENWKNVTPNFPNGISNVTIYKGEEEKATVRIVMKGSFDWNYKNNHIFGLMNDILSIKLRETMREDESGVYGVGCSGVAGKDPIADYDINIGFGCSTENVDKLVNVIFAEIEKLQTNGPTADDLDKVKKTKVRQHETELETNNYWASTLSSVMMNTSSAEDIKNFSTIVNSITANDIKKMAVKCYKKDNYVKGILLPEKK